MDPPGSSLEAPTSASTVLTAGNSPLASAGPVCPTRSPRGRPAPAPPSTGHGGPGPGSAPRPSARAAAHGHNPEAPGQEPNTLMPPPAPGATVLAEATTGVGVCSPLHWRDQAARPPVASALGIVSVHPAPRRGHFCGCKRRACGCALRGCSEGVSDLCTQEPWGRCSLPSRGDQTASAPRRPIRPKASWQFL